MFNDEAAANSMVILSLHDALPISETAEDIGGSLDASGEVESAEIRGEALVRHWEELLGLIAEVALEPSQWRASASDRKSTRLNSSHGYISYAVSCLEKKMNSSTIT